MRVLIILTMLISGLCLAGEKGKDLSNTDIGYLRIHTSKHAVTQVQKTALLNIPNLDVDCTRGIFIDLNDDQESYSAILAMLMAKSNIRVGFETTAKTPWGDATYCALTYLDVKK